MRQIIYYLSRDTNASGELSAVIGIWYVKPVRKKLHGVPQGYVWTQPIPGNVQGLYGYYTPDQVRAWYRTIPDTDLELIKCETQQEDKP